MDKENVVYIHTHTLECYSAIEKNEILPFTTTWMDFKDLTLSKVSQRRQILYDLICGMEEEEE